MTTIPDLNELRRIAEAARDADPAKANIAVDEFTMEEWIEFDETFDPASVLALLDQMKRLEGIGRIASFEARRADASERERDRFRSAIREALALHVKRPRPSLLDCTCGPSLLPCQTRRILTAALEGSKDDADSRNT